MNSPTNPSMSDQPSQVSLREILKTLFHSYSPRNETLAVNEALEKIEATIAEEVRLAKIAELERINTLARQAHAEGKGIKEIEDRIKNLSAPSDGSKS